MKPILLARKSLKLLFAEKYKQGKNFCPALPCRAARAGL
jgi:hypothetical protein